MSEPREIQGEEQTMRKKITIVCYTGEVDASPRTWVDRHSDEDMFESEVVVSKTYRLLGGDEIITITEDQFNDLAGMDIGELNLDVEEERKGQFSHELSDFSDRFRGEAFADNPNVDLGDVGEWRNDRSATRDGKILGDSVLYLRTEVDHTEMLVHPSEMEPGNVVDESEPEQVAVKIDVKFKNVTSDELEYLDDNVLKPAIDYLATHELFERVRWTNCERRTVEEMVCFNI